MNKPSCRTDSGETMENSSLVPIDMLSELMRGKEERDRDRTEVQVRNI
jgi:hypothetical protein